MTAIPSTGSPICVPLAGYPNPCASSVRASLRTVLRASLGSRCCNVVSDVLSSSFRRGSNIPDSSCLQLDRCTRKNGSWQNLAVLTSIHYTLWDRGELAVASKLVRASAIRERLCIRRSLVNLGVPVWSVVSDEGLLGL